MSEEVKPDALTEQLREVSYQLEHFVDPLTEIAQNCDVRSVRRAVIQTALLIGAAVGKEQTERVITYNQLVRSDWLGFRS